MATTAHLRRLAALALTAVVATCWAAAPAAAQPTEPTPPPSGGAFPDAAGSGPGAPGGQQGPAGPGGNPAGDGPGWAGSSGPDEYDQSGLAAWRTQCGHSGSGVAGSQSGPRATRSRITSGAATGTQFDCGGGRSDTSALDAATGGRAAGRKGIPAAHYDIGWSSSSGIGLVVNMMTPSGAGEEISRRLWGNGTQLVFGFNKMLVRASMGVVRWAFNFEIAGKLSGFVQDVASGFYGSLTGGPSGLNVYTLALFATLAAAAWMGVRGRGARAVGEVGLTWLVGVVFVAFVVTVPDGFGRIVEETLQAAGQLSASIAATTAAEAAPTAQCPDPSTAGAGVPAGTAAACPFTQSLHTAFIATPYDLINWGKPLGEADEASNDLAACAAARDEILEAGPHGTSDKPRFVMGAAGPECQALADFNHDPSVSRFGLSVMILVVAALVLVLVLLSAVTLVGAQLLMVGLGAVLPFAAVAGLLPGSARRLAFKWLGGVAKTVLVVVALSLALALYLVGMSYLQEAFADEAWIVQGGLLIAATAGMFWVRRKAVGAGKQAGVGAGRRLATSAPGRSRGGLVGAAERGWRRGGHQQNQLARGRQEYRRALGTARSATASAKHRLGSAADRAGSVAAAWNSWRKADLEADGPDAGSDQPQRPDDTGQPQPAAAAELAGGSRRPAALPAAPDPPTSRPDRGRPGPDPGPAGADRRPGVAARADQPGLGGRTIGPQEVASPATFTAGPAETDSPGQYTAPADTPGGQPPADRSKPTGPVKPQVIPASDYPDWAPDRVIDRTGNQPPPPGDGHPAAGGWTAPPGRDDGPPPEPPAEDDVDSGDE